MADITICNGNYCELRDTCYRYLAPKSEFRQSFFIEEPNNTSYDCDYYWEYCDKCNQYNGVHKLSCSTQKVTIVQTK